MSNGKLPTSQPGFTALCYYIVTTFNLLIRVAGHKF